MPILLNQIISGRPVDPLRAEAGHPDPGEEHDQDALLQEPILGARLIGVIRHGCQMATARFLRSYVYGPSGFRTMAPLRYAAKFDPFLSLDCAPTPSTLAQSKERKGSNFAS